MGKKTKMRDCPAAGHAITSAECGEGRHTTYACPDACPFNPFSTTNYEQFLELESAADAKFFQFLLEHVPSRSQFEAGLKPLIGENLGNPFFHYMAWHGHYRIEPEGDTVVGKLAKASFPGLTHDESVLMRCHLQMHPALLEAHRILDAKRVEVVDLLEPTPQPFTVVDRGFAAQVVRFGVYATHIVPQPNFHRIFGAGMELPELHPLDPLEAVTEIIRHLGGGSDTPTMRRWLMEHFPRFEKALMAVALARRQAMFKDLDAQFGKAVYELDAPFEQCTARLDEVPEIADDPLDESERKEGFVDARVWFAKAGDPEVEHVGESATLGRVLLGKTHWRFQGMGAARLETFRTRFESWMQERVRFAGERRDDLGARLQAQEPAYDPDLVPAALLKDTPRIFTTFSRVPAPKKPVSKEDFEAQQRRKHDTEFLDHGVPALDGQTPRQAAANPAMRVKLLRLMKYWVYKSDSEALETGQSQDVTWMLRELGLNEILFEPPPPRPARKRSSNQHLDETEAGPFFWNLPPPPALPPQPWSRDEASVRFETALTAFPRMTGALDYLLEMEYPLFEHLHQATDNMLEPREMQFLSPIAALLVLCYAPRDSRPPVISFGDLAEEFTRLIPEFQNLLRDASPDRVFDWMKDSHQPELLSIIFGVLLNIADDAPVKVRPRQGAVMKMLLILKVLINTLDRALREGR